MIEPITKSKCSISGTSFRSFARSGISTTESTLRTGRDRYISDDNSAPVFTEPKLADVYPHFINYGAFHELILVLF